MKPKRIQRKRTKGWRMPPGAIYVGRPTKYANYADWRELGRAGAVKDFRRRLVHRWWGAPAEFRRTLNELRGHDLACWCPLDEPCHADVWLELANPNGGYVMDWIPVEQGVKPLEIYLVCGRQDEDGSPAIDVAWWDDGWHFQTSSRYTFTPQFYAVIEWPPELIDDGEGL